MKKFVAIDIGGTFVKFAVVDEEANITASKKEKTPSNLDALLQLIKDYSKTCEDPAGIAISAPGAVSSEGVIYGTSALPYIHGPNIRTILEEQTNLPVYIENDANCAGYAEVWKGAAEGKNDVLAMTLGTGVGGAVFKNGKLHKGAHLHGGEFGYMLLDTDFEGEGKTLSALGSTAALIRSAARLKNVPASELTGEKVFALAEEGDEACKKAIDNWYLQLGVAIYNLQYIYDPEIILIGGGISARDDLIPSINKKLDEILAEVKIGKIKPQVAACHFRQNANLIGAVYAFMNDRN